MKKQLTLLLAALLLLGLLTGCGGDAQTRPGTVTPPATEPAATEPVTPPATEPEETPPPVTPPAAESREFTIGTFENGRYTNEFLGIGCALDESWQVSTALELLELNGEVEEILSEAQLINTLADAVQTSEMMAMNQTDLSSINIMYTKLDDTQKQAYAAMSEKEYLDDVLSQSDLIIALFSQTGIDVSAMELVDVTFAGESRLAIHTTAAIGDMDYYMLQLHDHSAGDYSALITFASFETDTTAQMAALFYPLA